MAIIINFISLRNGTTTIKGDLPSARRPGELLIEEFEQNTQRHGEFVLDKNPTDRFVTGLIFI